MRFRKDSIREVVCSMEKEEMDKIYVRKIEGRNFLGVPGKEAEIDDYKVTNYGDGNTEITIKIKGTSSIFAVIDA
jgi:hypothetical protein|nr:MAG TPA: hypothetical protein [Caudoviricetes sp.]